MENDLPLYFALSALTCLQVSYLVQAFSNDKYVKEAAEGFMLAFAWIACGTAWVLLILSL